jgi:oligopeptide transport system ATP-binding protein
MVVIASGRRSKRVAFGLLSALRPPPGCSFHPRCPKAMEICRTQDPALTVVVVGRAVACHLHGKV